MIKPNWKNSILNVSATFDKFLGNKNKIQPIKMLENILNKGYKNVVYICFDGLGMFPLESNLDKKSILRQSVRKKITSVFPSTTTNATTTLHSAKYPSEHGMFGWSLWFDELGRAVDLYTKTDSYSAELIQEKIVDDYITFDCFYENNTTDYVVSTVFPPYISSKVNNKTFSTCEEMFDNINELCQKQQKNFIFAYYGEPDCTMHEFGVNSNEAQKEIERINSLVEHFATNAKDTCLVITPDHGQRDIINYIELYKDTDLIESLRASFYLEARAVAFNVKNEKQFLNAVKKYKKYAKLYKTEVLIKRNYFGKNGDRFAMLGDYILIMKDIDSVFLFGEHKHRFKGHHTGLSKKEMILPLIIIER